MLNYASGGYFLRTELTDVPFETALRRGLGRAVLYLQEQADCRPFRDLLTDACRNDWRHDRQLDDRRVRYVFDVVHATGEPDFYADRILDSLWDATIPGDVDQLFDLAELFARNGDARMRPALYERFSAAMKEEPESYHLAGNLISLDGVTGYLAVVEQFQTCGLTPDDEDRNGSYAYHFALSDLADATGENPPRKAVALACALRPDLAEVINCSFVRQYEKRREERGRSEKPDKPVKMTAYDEIKAVIEGRVQSSRISRYLTQNVDPETLVRLAREMIEETDPARLRQYIKLFQQRPFPLNPELLFPLIHHEEIVISWRICGVLGGTTHPVIRAKALELLDTPEYEIRGLALLESNPGDGDIHRFRYFLYRFEEDGERHHVILQARDYLRRQKPEGSDVLLLELYRLSPCGICRWGVLEEYREAFGPLPDWLVEEAVYDANPTVREVATGPD